MPISNKLAGRRAGGHAKVRIAGHGGGSAYVCIAARQIRTAREGRFLYVEQRGQEGRNCKC